MLGCPMLEAVVLEKFGPTWYEYKEENKRRRNWSDCEVTAVGYVALKVQLQERFERYLMELNDLNLGDKNWT